MESRVVPFAAVLVLLAALALHQPLAGNDSPSSPAVGRASSKQSWVWEDAGELTVILDGSRCKQAHVCAEVFATHDSLTVRARGDAVHFNHPENVHSIRFVGGGPDATVVVRGVPFFSPRLEISAEPASEVVVDAAACISSESLTLRGASFRIPSEARICADLLAVSDAHSLDLEKGAHVGVNSFTVHSQWLVVNGDVFGKNSTEPIAIVINSDVVRIAGVLDASQSLLPSEVSITARSFVALGHARIAASPGQDGSGRIDIRAASLFSSGALDVVPSWAAGKGGAVVLLAKDAVFAGASIDVSGDEGGTIVLGSTVPRDIVGEHTECRSIKVDTHSTLTARGQGGDSGIVEVWSEDVTSFGGHVDASVVEISSRRELIISASAYEHMKHSTPQTIVFDPESINVVSDSIIEPVFAFEYSNPCKVSEPIVMEGERQEADLSMLHVNREWYSPRRVHVSDAMLLITSPRDAQCGARGYATGAIFHFDKLNGKLLSLLWGVEAGSYVGESASVLSEGGAVVTSRGAFQARQCTEKEVQDGATYLPTNGVGCGALSTRNTMHWTARAGYVNTEQPLRLVALEKGDGFAVLAPGFLGCPVTMEFVAERLGVLDMVTREGAVIYRADPLTDPVTGVVDSSRAVVGGPRLSSNVVAYAYGASECGGACGYRVRGRTLYYFVELLSDSGVFTPFFSSEDIKGDAFERSLRGVGIGYDPEDGHDLVLAVDEDYALICSDLQATGAVTVVSSEKPLRRQSISADNSLVGADSQTLCKCVHSCESPLLQLSEGRVALVASVKDLPAWTVIVLKDPMTGVFRGPAIRPAAGEYSAVMQVESTYGGCYHYGYDMAMFERGGQLVVTVIPAIPVPSNAIGVDGVPRPTGGMRGTFLTPGYGLFHAAQLDHFESAEVFASDAADAANSKVIHLESGDFLLHSPTLGAVIFCSGRGEGCAKEGLTSLNGKAGVQASQVLPLRDDCYVVWNPYWDGRGFVRHCCGACAGSPDGSNSMLGGDGDLLANQGVYAADRFYVVLSSRIFARGDTALEAGGGLIHICDERACVGDVETVGAYVADLPGLLDFEVDVSYDWSLAMDRTRVNSELLDDPELLTQCAGYDVPPPRVMYHAASNKVIVGAENYGADPADLAGAHGAVLVLERRVLEGLQPILPEHGLFGGEDIRRLGSALRLTDTTVLAGFNSRFDGTDTLDVEHSAGVIECLPDKECSGVVTVAGSFSVHKRDLGNGYVGPVALRADVADGIVQLSYTGRDSTKVFAFAPQCVPSGMAGDDIAPLLESSTAQIERVDQDGVILLASTRRIMMFTVEDLLTMCGSDRLAPTVTSLTLEYDAAFPGPFGFITWDADTATGYVFSDPTLYGVFRDASALPSTYELLNSNKLSMPYLKGLLASGSDVVIRALDEITIALLDDEFVVTGGASLSLISGRSVVFDEGAVFQYDLTGLDRLLIISGADQVDGVLPERVIAEKLTCFGGGAEPLGPVDTAAPTLIARVEFRAAVHADDIEIEFSAAAPTAQLYVFAPLTVDSRITVSFSQLLEWMECSVPTDIYLVYPPPSGFIGTLIWRGTVITSQSPMMGSMIRGEPTELFIDTWVLSLGDVELIGPVTVTEKVVVQLVNGRVVADYVAADLTLDGVVLEVELSDHAPPQLDTLMPLIQNATVTADDFTALYLANGDTSTVVTVLETPNGLSVLFTCADTAFADVVSGVLVCVPCPVPFRQAADGVSCEAVLHPDEWLALFVLAGEHGEIGDAADLEGRPCDTNRVTCVFDSESSYLRIEALDLSAIGLEGHLGEALNTFVLMRKLDVSLNTIDSVGILASDSLEWLDLSFNALAGDVELHLSAVSHLDVSWQSNVAALTLHLPVLETAGSVYALACNLIELGVPRLAHADVLELTGNGQLERIELQALESVGTIAVLAFLPPADRVKERAVVPRRTSDPGMNLGDMTRSLNGTHVNETSLWKVDAPALRAAGLIILEEQLLLRDLDLHNLIVIDTLDVRGTALRSLDLSALVLSQQLSLSGNQLDRITLQDEITFTGVQLHNNLLEVFPTAFLETPAQPDLVDLRSNRFPCDAIPEWCSDLGNRHCLPCIGGDGPEEPETPNECPEGSLKTAPGVCGCDVADVDSDGDAVFDCVDNCPLVANGDQADENGDGVGDACQKLPPAEDEPLAMGLDPGTPVITEEEPTEPFEGAGELLRVAGLWDFPESPCFSLEQHSIKVRLELALGSEDWCDPAVRWLMASGETPDGLQFLRMERRQPAESALVVKLTSNPSDGLADHVVRYADTGFYLQPDSVFLSFHVSEYTFAPSQQHLRFTVDVLLAPEYRLLGRDRRNSRSSVYVFENELDRSSVLRLGLFNVAVCDGDVVDVQVGYREIEPLASAGVEQPDGVVEVRHRFTVDLPRFETSCSYDPDFAVLLAGQNGGGKDDTFSQVLPWLSLGLVGVAALVVVAVAVTYESKRRRDSRISDRELSKKMSSFHSESSSV